MLGRLTTDTFVFTFRMQTRQLGFCVKIRVPTRLYYYKPLVLTVCYRNHVVNKFDITKSSKNTRLLRVEIAFHKLQLTFNYLTTRTPDMLFSKLIFRSQIIFIGMRTAVLLIHTSNTYNFISQEYFILKKIPCLNYKSDNPTVTRSFRVTMYCLFPRSSALSPRNPNSAFSWTGEQEDTLDVTDFVL